nr:hypothetical protein [Tanacetum cinerariifolium]
YHVNVIPLDHVDDVPVVEPNQHDDVPVVPELVLEDEDEDPKEEEFKEEEEEDDMEVDIDEDENEPKLTYPYEEVDPLNPPSPASESEHEDVTKVENPIEHEDETVPASVHESKKGKAKDEYYGKLILDLGNEVCFSVEQGMVVMEKLVEKRGNVEDKVECKKLKKKLEEARFSNTFLRMQNERVERNPYWTRDRAHEFYQEMIRRGFVFEETPNEAIDVPLLFVDAAIAAARARHANTGNDARGSGPVKGQDVTPVVRECTFDGFMKCNPTAFHGTKGAVELRRWFKKTESVFGISECVEGKKVKFVAATLQGPALTWWNAKVLQGEEFVATGANALPIPTCYDCGKQGHTKDRCLKKVKQEKVGKVRGRAYAIKDTELKGPNVVTGTFLLNNRYDFVLFDSGSDRSFVDTRFMNHIFEIDLMPIELGTFDIIIGMDWLAKHDAVIVCGKKVVRIPYGNKMLIVKSDKGVSRLKEKRLKDVHVIRDFLEVFHEDLPGLPPPRQVEF